jgi:hypothetical protein
MFKNQSIPLKYSHPIGNPVAVLSSHKKKIRTQAVGRNGSADWLQSQTQILPYPD